MPAPLPLLPGSTLIIITATMVEGGSEDESNLRASCRECNEARRVEQSRRGRGVKNSIGSRRTDALAAQSDDAYGFTGDLGAPYLAAG